MPLPAHAVRFGPFQLDLRAAELHHDGTTTKIPEQPFQVLVALIEHPGDVVTREELCRRLWNSDTFVDFEHGLNTAVKRLREALGDSAETPRYIETLPRHGYRLVVPVEKTEPAVLVPEVPHRRRKFWLVTVLLVAAATAGIVWRQRLLDHYRPMNIESLAVLPLENLSGNPEEEYFADGMTEALIMELGKMQALRVISWQSVKQFKGTNKPVPQIAGELHVDAVVEGSVLRVGEKVRITAQLVRAKPEQNLWSQSYERDLRDILALQANVARDITGKIRIELTTEQKAPVSSTHALNPLALDAYLKGQYEFDKRHIPKATQYFEKAVALDPQYALAHSALALAYAYSTILDAAPPAFAFSRAEAAASKSLQIDDGLADGHAALAWVKAQYYWDWAGAEAEFQRALELNPNAALVRSRHAWYLAWIGKFDEAIPESQRALELNPNAASARRVMGAIYYCHRQYAEALQQWNAALELSPNDPIVVNDLGKIYMQKGLYAEAVSQFEKLRALTQGETYATATGGGLLGYAYARAGRKSEAREILNDFIARSRQTYVSPLNVAMIYLGLGDKEQALEWLQKGYDVRDADMILINVWPLWDPLRSDPRFQDLLRRMNFP